MVQYLEADNRKKPTLVRERRGGNQGGIYSGWELHKVDSLNRLCDF